MKNRRASALLLFVVAALVAGPSLGLRAASPCGSGTAMACCGEMERDGDSDAPPCGCAMRSTSPAPAVLGAAPPPVVLDVAEDGGASAPEALPAAADAAILPRARTGPLFLLYSSLLN